MPREGRAQRINDTIGPRAVCPVCGQEVRTWVTRQTLWVMAWHQRPAPAEPGKYRRCPGSNLTEIEASTL
jgi:hypothetical protein